MALQSGYTDINSLLANPRVYYSGSANELFNPGQVNANDYLSDPRMRTNLSVNQIMNPDQSQANQVMSPANIYGADTVNPQFQYKIGQPEPQQPSFQYQQGAEQPGQAWQQGLQQAIQDGSIREYLDKTVYKRETEAERKKREEEEKKKEALTQMGDKSKGYTSAPYQMQFTPVNTLLR